MSERRSWSYAEREVVPVQRGQAPAYVLLPDGTELVCRSGVDANAVAQVLRLLVLVQREPEKR